MIVERLGISDREMVCFVGAGGKSTVLLMSGRELAAADTPVLLTTTTKMSPDQIPSWTEAFTPGPDLEEALGSGRSAFAVGSIDGDKVIGIDPEYLDEVFETRAVDHILVEADGARRRSFKAPAPHEPVIPSGTTLVVAIVGIGVVGRTIGEAAHRPDLVAGLLGTSVESVIRPEDIATVITHPAGGLKEVPDSARFVVVLTGVSGEEPEAHAADAAAVIRDDPRVDRVVLHGLVTPDRPS